MRFSSVRRTQLVLFAASLIAALLTFLGPAPHASAEPQCTAFANAPALVAGRIEANGGVTCTSSTTGGLRVDVTLYRDGTEVDWAVNTCHREQQCGALVREVDVDGGQEWCALSVAATSSGILGTGGASRSGMICEKEAF